MRIRVTTYERRVVKLVQEAEVPGHSDLEGAREDYKANSGWGFQVWHQLEEVIECEVLEENIEEVRE